MDTDNVRLNVRKIIVAILASIALISVLHGFSDQSKEIKDLQDKPFYGNCFIQKDIYFLPVKCTCNCKQYGRDSKLKCTNCHHFENLKTKPYIK